MVPVAGSDVLAALGVPPASDADAAWAEQCAAAANAYGASLPAAAAGGADFQQGLIMLAVALYSRRPQGAFGVDGDISAPAAVDSTISRLLRIGYYQKPVAR